MLHTHMQTALANVSESCAGEQDRLQEYHEVLLHGISYFKPQAPSSRKAVESETSLGIGKKKIPVDPALRSLAFELSGNLVRTDLVGYCKYHHTLLRRTSSAPGQVACRACLSMAPVYCGKWHILDAEA